MGLYWIMIPVGVLIGLFLGGAFLLTPPLRGRKKAQRLFSQPYAHRGLYTADQSVPENSAAAFRAAIKAGYGFELDLTLTADGEAIVFHDDTLERACGVNKAVAEITAAQASSHVLFNTTEKIPLFRDVLDMVSGRVPLIVELKSTPEWKRLCRAADALLAEYQGDYCIESFDPRIVMWFAIHRPDTIRGQLLSGQVLWRRIPRLFFSFFHRPHFIAYHWQNSKRCRRMLNIYRCLGGYLVAWTVSDPDGVAYCRENFHTIIFEHLPADVIPLKNQ